MSDHAEVSELELATIAMKKLDVWLSAAPEHRSYCILRNAAGTVVFDVVLRDNQLRKYQYDPRMRPVYGRSRGLLSAALAALRFHTTAAARQAAGQNW